MRTTEERIWQIQRRTVILQEKQRRRKQRILDFACMAACILLVTGLGVWMPGLVGNLSDGHAVHASGVASLIGNTPAAGYILMGILAFLLGVCSTVLLYRLRHRSEDRREKKKQENDDEL